MSQVLPPFFIALSAFALLLAVLALYASLRQLLTAESKPTGLSATGSEARLALVDEKAALLKALKELEFERDMGKISEQDFDAQNARYRARAKDVMRHLDAQLGDFRKQAEQLVEAELSAPAEAPKAKAKGGKKKAASEPKAEVAVRTCEACQTENDSDAVFCKKCGKSLGGEQEA